MFYCDLNPIAATDVMVVLGNIPVSPIGLHELCPLLVVIVESRTVERLNYIRRLSPCLKRCTNRHDICFSYRKHKCRASDFQDFLFATTAMIGRLRLFTMYDVPPNYYYLDSGF